MHYISNIGEDRNVVARLGFNLFDTGPYEDDINSLKPGQQALVWLGNLDNDGCTAEYSWPDFKAAVDRLTDNPKVFGYYIADEPHPALCPDAVAHIRQRADYIRRHAPAQRSFIVVLDGPNACGSNLGCEYSALRPELSHVDLVGIDPYPCSMSGGCIFDDIDEWVHRAVANGIPIEAVVPVIQAFGQSCDSEKQHYYAVPTQNDLREILARFGKLVPNPEFDFVYTWSSDGAACPGLDRADGTDGIPDLQSVIRTHNAAPST